MFNNNSKKNKAKPGTEINYENQMKNNHSIDKLTLTTRKNSKMY